MAESPVKHKPTSRVIDSLHTQIDDLKTELEDVRLSHGEYKKKALILASKNESLVDQLANCKHENDMINAVLKRKERRIVDLEELFDELSSLNDSLKLTTKSLKIRCDNLQESSASSTAEYERLKIAYDAMVASQNEYKRHYQEELNKLSAQFESYKTASQKEFHELSDRLSSNDKDVETLIDSLANKRKVMDNLYVNRNKAVLDLLSTLAKAAKLHGEESRTVLKELVDTINSIREKFPDLQDKIAEHQPITVDIDELLSDAAASSETSLAELDPVSSEEAKGGVQRSASTRRRKHKRQLMRISPEPSAVLNDVIPETLPKLRSTRYPSDGRSQPGDFQPSHQQHHNQNQRTGSGQRNSSISSNSLFSGTGNRSNSRHRVSQSGSLENARGGRNFSSGQGTAQNNTMSVKNKRRLFHGGSSNYNCGINDRKPLGKADV